MTYNLWGYKSLPVGLYLRKRETPYSTRFEAVFLKKFPFIVI